MVRCDHAHQGLTSPVHLLGDHLVSVINIYIFFYCSADI